jgi:hypothetical protein
VVPGCALLSVVTTHQGDLEFIVEFLVNGYGFGRDLVTRNHHFITDEPGVHRKPSNVCVVERSLVLDEKVGISRYYQVFLLRLYLNYVVLL